MRVTPYQKLCDCLKEKRIPGIHRVLRYLSFLGLACGEFFDRCQGEKAVGAASKGKFLYASPVGKNGKENLAKVIEKFGHRDFDYLIFVYDDTLFDEEIFRPCNFVREKGLKWFFMKKYLTPEFCKKYSYFFIWDDDIDVEHFSYEEFIKIMKANRLELAQPALEGGNATHEITLKRKKGIGRLVDFVEIMVPVFTQQAWIRWWYMMESDTNFWGFGYDDLARSFCGYKRMGIIDAQAIHHMNPPQYEIDRSKTMRRVLEGKDFLKKYYFLKPTFRVSYAHLFLASVKSGQGPGQC